MQVLRGSSHVGVAEAVVVVRSVRAEKGQRASVEGRAVTRREALTIHLRELRSERKRVEARLERYENGPPLPSDGLLASLHARVASVNFQIALLEHAGDFAMSSTLREWREDRTSLVE